MFGNTPLSVLILANIFIPLWCSFGDRHIIDESVLLLSLTGNLTVFKNTRITMTLITCIAMYRSDIYYSSVGYCLFVFGFCQNLLSDKQTTPHLNRNRVCINLIYSYSVSIFIIFDTAKFPLFVSFPK